MTNSRAGASESSTKSSGRKSIRIYAAAPAQFINPVAQTHTYTRIPLKGLPEAAIKGRAPHRTEASSCNSLPRNEQLLHFVYPGYVAVGKVEGITIKRGTRHGPAG